MTSDPLNTRNLDAEHEDSLERQYAYNFDYLMHGWLLERVNRHLVKRDHCLELGCYRGQFTRALSNMYEKVDAVEGSRELCNIISSEHPLPTNINLINSLFEEFNPDKQYDAIFLIHTLEHLDNPKALLRQSVAWLKTGGRMIVMVPNANAISRQIAVSSGLIDYNTSVTQSEYEHGHRRTYSLDMLSHECTSAGFNIVDRGGIFLKALANFQLDRCIKQGIIGNEYLTGCLELGKSYPDFCSSIFVVLET
jgi:2-polyprenyl-3-methyl-5-hydroxy-6-metoxy-1,4-benzoquinol methylase